MSGSLSLAVAPVTGSLLVTCYYDGEDPLKWAVLHDSTVLAWLIGQSGANPLPVIVGTLPPLVDTPPIYSPQWIVREGGPSGMWFLPDIDRGTIGEMLTFIATNNGAKRQLFGNFADTNLVIAWKEWADAYPDLALKERPYA